MAERLRYMQNTEHTKCLLGEIQYSGGNYWGAKETLKNSNSERSKYLYALACYKTNDLNEAENVLLSNITNNLVRSLDETVNGAHGIYLLG